MTARTLDVDKLHGDIMNVQIPPGLAAQAILAEAGIKTGRLSATTLRLVLMAYKTGHKNARHRAAEMAVDPDRELFPK